MKNKNFFMVDLKKIKNACSTLWGTPQRQVAFGGAYNVVAGYFLLASFFPSTEKVAKYVSFANANSSSFAKQNSLSKTVGLAT